MEGIKMKHTKEIILTAKQKQEKIRREKYTFEFIKSVDKALYKYADSVSKSLAVYSKRLGA
jgi:hypothetical protein